MDLRLVIPRKAYFATITRLGVLIERSCTDPCWHLRGLAEDLEGLGLLQGRFRDLVIPLDVELFEGQYLVLPTRLLPIGVGFAVAPADIQNRGIVQVKAGFVGGFRLGYELQVERG